MDDEDDEVGKEDDEIRGEERGERRGEERLRQRRERGEDMKRRRRNWKCGRVKERSGEQTARTHGKKII